MGDYDNYVSEILDADGALSAFRPEVAMLIPSERRCSYTGHLADPQPAQREAVRRTTDDLLRLCSVLFERSGTEVLLCNFPSPARFDLGAFRTRTLGSDWTFRRAVNIELGLAAPSYVHICDVDFLASRRGGLASRDDRLWFESKQPYSPDFMVEVAREIGHLVRGLRTSPRKVLALDLDNTLWGGVIGDDGLEGIEIGDTSPRGEAFKAFQSYVLSLRKRGVLLAVVSKNDHHRAAEVFDKHPEMVLRMTDLVAFKANWEPKSDNLRQIAEELNLGLDSFVFVDDNPAEIDIVRQFAPEVTTILLGPDHQTTPAPLQDCRLFEPRTITLEDAARTEQYRTEATCREAQTSATDMPSYLRSLEMRARVLPFSAADVPRITQLINKSNQFNLTTHRRTEAEIAQMVGSTSVYGFTVRLADRFRGPRPHLRRDRPDRGRRDGDRDLGDELPRPQASSRGRSRQRDASGRARAQRPPDPGDLHPHGKERDGPGPLSPDGLLAPRRAPGPLRLRDRPAGARRFHNRHRGHPGAMNQADVIQRMQPVFDDLFLEHVELKPELSAKEVDEWDSLMQVSLVVAIEQAFGIRFRVGEASKGRATSASSPT